MRKILSNHHSKKIRYFRNSTNNYKNKKSSVNIKHHRKKPT